MSDSEKDTFSRVLALLAIVIAVASLTYTIWSDQKSEIEDLIIYTARVHDDYETEIIPLPLQDLPAVLPVYYECILVNNGKMSISIVDYDLQQITEDYPIKYSYMDGGLFDSSGKQLQLPLDIDSKKSYRFFVKVGVAVHPKAYELISKNFTSQKKIPIKELTYHLARNRVDFYGNTVDPYIDDQGNLLGFNVPMKNRMEQIFSINFKTSQGNYFSDTVFWYKMLQF